MFDNIYMTKNIKKGAFYSNIMQNPHFPLQIQEQAQGISQYTITDFYISYESFYSVVPITSNLFVNGFLVSFSTQGTGEIIINGRNYKIGKGDILLVSPQMMLRRKQVSEDYNTLNIIAPMDAIIDLPTPLDTDIINMARRQPILHVQGDDWAELLDYVALLNKAFVQRDQAYHEDLLRTLFYALLLHLGSLYKQLGNEEESTLRAERLSDEFFRLLSVYYKTHRSVKFYADQMHLTPKHLSRAVRSITGKSMIEWMDDAILLEIRVQLKTTDLTIENIAFNLNFSSSSALVSFFKKHTGLTPLQYRKTKEW